MTLTEQQEFVLNELGKSTAWMQKQLHTERPMHYLEYRRIPLEIARTEGLMFLPRPEGEGRSEGSKELFMWTGRLLAPTWCPQGRGYSGRMLGWWRPGMDENTHAQLLKRMKTPKYIKTARAGWLWRPAEVGRIVIMVEGLFDRLALLAAGFAPGDVIAVGTDSANLDWLPLQTRTIILAFDSDAEDEGKRNTRNLLVRLRMRGIRVIKGAPPKDGLGKDSSERWRVAGDDGVAYLKDIWRETHATYSPAVEIEEDPTDSMVCKDCGPNAIHDDQEEYHYTQEGICVCQRHHNARMKAPMTHERYTAAV